MTRLVWLPLATLSLLLFACSSDSKPASTSTAERSTATIAAATPSPVAGGTPQPAAIDIDEPAANAVVRVPIVVRGRSNVFEGALVVELRTQGGDVLCERSVQSTSGSGTPGTWETTIAVPPPLSPESAVLRAFSRSPRDGADENVVTRDIQAATDTPAIVINSPQCATQIAAGSVLQVIGTASVFEAQFTVELRDASGRTVLSNPVTADAGAPARGNWSTTLNIASLVAGEYELIAFDRSERDGSVENEFSIPVRITV